MRETETPCSNEFMETQSEMCVENLHAKAMHIPSKRDKARKGPYSMFYVVPEGIMRDYDLTPCSRLVFSALLSHIQTKGGGKCNPGTDCLAQECAISVRQVSYSLENLRQQRWITWIIDDRKRRFFRIYAPGEHSFMMSQKNREHRVKDSLKK